jgi:secernin
MCDTLCVVGAGRTLFAKNSDRPSGEPQVVEAHPPRDPGGTIRTQYLDIPDAGALALVGSRPAWLWGLEHGVNEDRVAIGNEAVYTRIRPVTQPAALIGMDLVRLGLERGRSALEALDVMTELLERYGQAGECYEDGGAYHSSFLVADPQEAWVLETAGKTWAAKRHGSDAAISNRLSLSSDWDDASSDVESGTDFQQFRDPGMDTGFADVRLAASRACVAKGASELRPADLAAHLRDHGKGPWGTPNGEGGEPDPVPPSTEFTVCMHVQGISVTTAAMICELPESPAEPVKAWAALGAPCTSVFVPLSPPDDVPGELGQVGVWKRFAALRERAEQDPEALSSIRGVLGPLEDRVWEAGDASVGNLEAALDELGV